MTSAGPSRSFPWPLYMLVLAGLLLFALLPVIAFMVSVTMAGAANCALSEAAVHSCVIAGMELGGVLSFLFVMGWFAYVTLPLGGGAIIVWLIMISMHRLAWKKLQEQP
jgi:hypothetical protein